MWVPRVRTPTLITSPRPDHSLPLLTQPNLLLQTITHTHLCLWLVVLEDHSFQAPYIYLLKNHSSASLKQDLLSSRRRPARNLPAQHLWALATRHVDHDENIKEHTSISPPDPARVRSFRTRCRRLWTHGITAQNWEGAAVGFCFSGQKAWAVCINHSALKLRNDSWRP